MALKELPFNIPLSASNTQRIPQTEQSEATRLRVS
jgi:hypothetical protein